MKNCPFCGSFNTKFAGEYKEVNKEIFHVVFVECLDCKCKGPSIGGFGMEAENNEVAEALDKWNKRQES